MNKKIKSNQFLISQFLNYYNLLVLHNFLKYKYVNFVSKFLYKL